MRKFILREDPAYLHYYDPAGGEDPLGAIHLRGCVVTSVESNPDGKNEFLFEREVSTQTPSPQLGILSLQQSLTQLSKHKHG